MYLFTHVCSRVCLCKCIYIHTCIHTYMYGYNTHNPMHESIFLCRVCVCIYIHICIYVYTHIYIRMDLQKIILCIRMHAYLSATIQIRIHTLDAADAPIHTYIETYTHTVDISCRTNTYIHTYTHTYIH